MASISLAQRERLSELVIELMGEESQRSFAKLLGVTQAAVNCWICGKTWPGLENLERLARAKGVPTNELIDYLNKGKPMCNELSSRQIILMLDSLTMGEIRDIVKAGVNRLTEVALTSDKG